MATIPVDRIRHYHYDGMGSLPPQFEWQLKASEAARVAGTFWTVASGVVTQSYYRELAGAGNPAFGGDYYSLNVTDCNAKLFLNGSSVSHAAA